MTMEDLKETIETYLETLPKNSKKEVAFFGGTFTGISFDLQRQYLETVHEYIKKGLVGRYCYIFVSYIIIAN